MEKGCSQGSIIGPAAWIWTMDVVLNKLTENIPSEYGEFVAYADDLACVMKGDTRSEILTYSERVIEILTTWCNSHKLRISEKKTVAVQLKGSLDKSRLAIKVNGKNTNFVKNVMSRPGLPPRELLCACDEFPGSVEISSLFSPSQCLRPTMTGNP